MVRAQFETEGFVGPIKLLSASDCALISTYLDEDLRPEPVWSKGLAAVDRNIYEVATKREIVSLVADLIGADVNLWGASFVDRSEGQPHPWHTDIETSAPTMRSVSIWIGLRNTSAESSLNIIPGSHHYGKTVQEVAQAHSIDRDKRSAEVMLDLAKAIDSRATLVRPEMSDGDAILFDGRLWHGTLNTRASGCRRALLLQYAAADMPIRIPDFRKLDWPFAFTRTRPPVISVHGTPRPRVNRVVDPPMRTTQPRSLAPISQEFPWPLPKHDLGWRMTPPLSRFNPNTAAYRMPCVRPEARAHPAPRATTSSR